MHDGRFLTIDEVINHYSEGLVNSSTIDPLMKKVNQGGVQLSPNEKANLKAFLLTLTDGIEFLSPLSPSIPWLNLSLSENALLGLWQLAQASVLSADKIGS